MNEDVVIDASVAAKWVLLEAGSDAAAELLRPGIAMHTPELCLAELSNVLWKRARRGELTHAEAADALKIAMDLPVRHHPHAPLAPDALLISLEFDITAYDAFYVALARSLDAVMITADRRLAGAGRTDPDWPVRML